MSSHYILYALSPCSSTSSSHPDLPFLDPAALYAATTLLLNAGISFQIAAPNAWLHSQLPRLERMGGTVVAEGVKEIESFARSRRERRKELASDAASSSSRSTPLQDSRLKALAAHTSSQLEPLVYSTLLPPSTATSNEDGFSKGVFDQISFHAYASGLNFPTSRVVPHRLRQRVTDVIESSSSQLCFDSQSSSSPKDMSPELEGEERAKEEERRRIREQMKTFGSTSRLFKFGQSEKEGMKRGWTRQRWIEKVEAVLRPLKVLRGKIGTTLEEEEIHPTLVQLFSLLAPLIIVSEQGSRALASHPFIGVLQREEYTSLRGWVKEIWEKTWKVEREKTIAAGSAWSEVLLGTAETLLKEDNDELLDAASRASSHTKGTAASTSSSWSSYLPSFLQSSPPSTSSKKQEHPSSKSPSELRAERNLSIGRALWIASALAGTVGWLFLSGVVEIGEEEYYEEEEEEVEEGEEEPQAGDGWVFQRSGEAEEEQEEEIELDDGEDLTEGGYDLDEDD